jgi:two-component sensor histidine kinase
MSTPEGCLNVEWSHPKDGRLLLRWLETGGPLVLPPTHQGFGTRVMENMIKQLKGEMRFEWKPQGLFCEIVIPCAVGAPAAVTGASRAEC